MNYIDLINHFWRLDDGAQFTGWETKLYFYLIKTANGLGWVNEFWHSDRRVSANVGMSINTMKTSRNRLKQAGLIDFVPGGKGHGNKTRYRILPPKVWSKTETEALATNRNAPPPKKNAKTIQPPAPTETAPAIKPDDTAAAVPHFVAENRNLAAAASIPLLTREQLKADLTASEICRMAAKNCRIKAADYATAVDNFVETKFGLGQDKNWKDIVAAREHFMYWLPYYQLNKENRNGKRDSPKSTGRQIVEQSADDDSVVEPGADGVLRRISGKGVQTFAG